MTTSCVAITAARLASIAASQSAKKLSGVSATPSRDNNSYTTIFRTPPTSDPWRCYWLTDQAAGPERSVGVPTYGFWCDDRDPTRLSPTACPDRRLVAQL